MALRESMLKWLEKQFQMDLVVVSRERYNGDVVEHCGNVSSPVHSNQPSFLTLW